MTEPTPNDQLADLLRRVLAQQAATSETLSSLDAAVQRLHSGVAHIGDTLKRHDEQFETQRSELAAVRQDFQALRRHVDALAQPVPSPDTASSSEIARMVERLDRVEAAATLNAANTRDLDAKVARLDLQGRFRLYELGTSPPPPQPFGSQRAGYSSLHGSSLRHHQPTLAPPKDES